MGPKPIGLVSFQEIWTHKDILRMLSERKDHVRMQQKVAIHKPRRQGLQETKPVDTLIWDS